MSDPARKIEIIDEDYFSPTTPDRVKQLIHDLDEGTGVTGQLSDDLTTLTERVTAIEKLLVSSGVSELVFRVVDGVLTVEYEEEV